MTATFTLRPYQREAVERSVQFLTAKSDRHGLLVLPTGSGKSPVERSKEVAGT